MKALTKLLVVLGLAAMAGCVVAPVGPRGYVRPGVVVAPAPVVVRPYYVW